MATYVITENFVYPIDKRGNEYGWGWSLLNTPEALYGKEACKCNRSPEDSFDRIVSHFSKILPDATERQILKLVG